MTTLSIKNYKNAPYICFANSGECESGGTSSLFLKKRLMAAATTISGDEAKRNRRLLFLISKMLIGYKK